MKYILTISLAATAAFAYAKENGPSGKIITTNKGDKIMMEPVRDRAVHIANKKEASSVVKIGGERPVLLNGKDIYYFKDHKDDDWGQEEVKLWVNEYALLNEQVEKAIAEEKKQLPDGYYEYGIDQMVVDEHGTIVYYEPKGLSRKVLDENEKLVPASVPEDIARVIIKKIPRVLDAYRYTPFVHQCKATPYLSSYTYSFKVDHGS